MGSEKERQRWGRGDAKVTEKGDVNYRDMQTFDRADRGYIMCINCKTVTRKQKGLAP